MTKSLAKVQKKITKKGANITSLNENSRNAQRLRRASGRDDKLARVSSARAKLNKPYMERISFLRSVAETSSSPFSIDSLRDLIQGYIHRDDEEIAKFESERRPGRPRSNREDLLKQRIAVEEKEYDTGFWIPDMMDATNLGLLREWTGEWTSLGTMRFVRVPKEGGVRDSRFPPKGMS